MHCRLPAIMVGKAAHVSAVRITALGEVLKPHSLPLVGDCEEHHSQQWCMVNRLLEVSGG